MAGQQRETKNIVERAVSGALADIEKYAPDEFKQMQADATIKDGRDKSCDKCRGKSILSLKLNSIQNRLKESVNACRNTCLLTESNMIETGLISANICKSDINKKEDGHHWADHHSQRQNVHGFQKTRHH